ncbi:hypothetical protein A7U60_g5083 [Sanghuangporus baumii]|uniref:DUF659 domain-containing protein n=1 Tax=Sanghuangporus baumii TaxID=108892 RepID=A0A9Q5HXC7_SANBA|nr:hypothetical protein A7U60_g5083 [Sanghuangporus baumii]
MSVRILSPEELEEILQELTRQLTCLGSNILDGSNHYNFQNFAYDPSEAADIGEEGAVNHTLEVILAPKGRGKGIEFKEKGPGLMAVVDVLRYYNKKYEGNAVLQKWVRDLLDAAIKSGEAVICNENNIPVDPVLVDSTNTVTKRKQASPDEAEGQNKIKRTKFDVPKNRGGRPGDPLLHKLRVPIPGPGKKFRCVGHSRGCRVEWEKQSAFRSRVFKHAHNCHFVPDSLKREVSGQLQNRSLGHYFEKKHEVTDSKNDQTTSSETQKTGDLKYLVEESGCVQLIKKINFAVLKLICTCGIPPSIVDRQEWKELLCVANPKYDPPSSKTFTDSLIPSEHAFVKCKQLEHLQSRENLTISFNGGTTAGLQSIYMVHVITPEHRAFLVEGSEASTVSHTSQHLFDVLNSVIKTIGPERFRGITSDNTGNTTVARKLIREAYPWIIILPDPCHRLNLLCKDIGKIDAFKEIIAQVQRVVKYFHKSTNSTSTLKLKRRELGISQGIKSVGKTRFGTIYYAALSIERNYGALVELFKGGDIKASEIAPYFVPGFTASAFSFGLQRLTMVLSPMAKSITCLESSHSTVADVYLFWLAVTADIHFMLSQDGLATSDSEKIRRAVNRRFNQMVNEAPSDVYITGFVLDPRFRNVHIMQDLNPLEIPKIKIGPRDSTGKPAKSNETLPPTLVRVGNFLLSMLREHYRSLNKDIAGLKQADARLRLPRQILEYKKCDYPFNMRFKKNSTAGDWWAKLDKNPDAQPLAKLARSLFEVLPNSMCDERTASTFTWLNSPLRNKQDSSTLARMTTIREWYRFNPENRPDPFCPTVKFCNMTELLFRDKVSSSPPPVSLEKHRETCDSSSEEIVFDAQDVDFDNFVEENDNDNDDDAKDNIYKYAADKLDLASQINLACPVLRDVLSDKGVDSRILEMSANVDKTDERCSGEDSDDLEDDTLWKMD